MNEREKQKWYDLELRKVEALEKIAKKLNGISFTIKSA